MSQDDQPVLSDKGRTEAAARQRRQAEALRANLARRKAQGRARAGSEGGGESCPSPDPGVQDKES